MSGQRQQMPPTRYAGEHFDQNPRWGAAGVELHQQRPSAAEEPIGDDEGHPPRRRRRRGRGRGRGRGGPHQAPQQGVTGPRQAQVEPETLDEPIVPTGEEGGEVSQDAVQPNTGRHRRRRRRRRQPRIPEEGKAEREADEFQLELPDGGVEERLLPADIFNDDLPGPAGEAQPETSQPARRRRRRRRRGQRGRVRSAGDAALPEGAADLEQEPGMVSTQRTPEGEAAAAALEGEQAEAEARRGRRRRRRPRRRNRQGAAGPAGTQDESFAAADDEALPGVD